MIDCVRKHGFDAPTDPAAFKQWLATEHPDGLDAALRDCKLALDPAPTKPQGDCSTPPKEPAPTDTPAAPDDGSATTADPERAT
jgi:hypothetical protein